MRKLSNPSLVGVVSSIGALGAYMQDILKTETVWYGLKYWLHMDSWSLQEASLILCGIIPDSVHYEKDDEKNKIRAFFKFDDSFHNLKGTGDSDSDSFYFICQFHTSIKRLIKSESINEMSPSHWVAKAKIKMIDTSAIDKCFTEIECKQSGNKIKSLSTRTENNYLRLIFALAYEIKDFNPTKPYEAAQLIIDKTEIDISRDTLAVYISKAYELEIKNRA